MLRKIFQTLPQTATAAPRSTLIEHYQREVAALRLAHDAAQLETIEKLHQLCEQIICTAWHNALPSLDKLRSVRPEKCPNLYLFGEVGAGKSLLMQLFYQNCPIEQKRRVHFNVFILEVHSFIHTWQQKNNQTDALTAFAKNLRQSVLLLCFDEFHVSDIADAMILGRLFNLLFKLGTVIVITSNRHPDNLYQGGVQRDQLIFFSTLLKENTHIIELKAKHDYRLQGAKSHSPYYHFPLNNNAADFIKNHYQRLSQNAPLQASELILAGRQLQLIAHYQHIIVISFSQLCQNFLAAADYLHLSKQVTTLLLTDIPQLTPAQRNEAKRFVTLIDILYENKIKLICSAQVCVNSLYTQGDGAFEFKRTVSRLIEMQSEHYMSQ